MDKIQWGVPVQALERYNPQIVPAKALEQGHTISILDEIGEGWYGEGITAKLVSSILRKADGEDVSVNINSAGGDFFEGIAIHSLLSNYEGHVTINVLGLCASAASVIAMAGDSINIAKSGFMMVHNSWTVAIGNASDMQEVSEMLNKIDGAMVNLYADATGIDKGEIVDMLAKTTWLDGEECLEKGFATALLGDDMTTLEKDEKSGYNASLKKIDTLLAKAQMPRSERRKLIKNLVTPCASPTLMPCAKDQKLSESLKGLLKSLKS